MSRLSLAALAALTLALFTTACPDPNANTRGAKSPSSNTTFSERSDGR
jgi:hypothetical protein